MGFVEGEQGRIWGARSQDDRRREFLDLMTRTFGPRAAEPITYVDKVWADDEWARGCYVANMAPGAWTEYGRFLRAPCGPIHWAGTETATEWNGYIDGAVQAGERAAGEVLQALVSAQAA
jgi:monoamine oxidase